MTKATVHPASRRTRRRTPLRACASDPDELRRFALRRLIEQEEERGKIARLLHDDLGQSLLGLNLGLYRLSRVCEDDEGLSELVSGLRALLAGSARAVRRIAVDFRPLASHGGDLHALLLTLVEHVQAEYGLRCITAVTPGAMQLGREYAIALQRLLRLALHGIVRSGLAALPGIRIRHEGGLLSVEIHEEAGGIREAPTPERAEPPALAELREWIRVLGGELCADAADHGAIMSFALPLPE